MCPDAAAIDLVLIDLVLIDPAPMDTAPMDMAPVDITPDDVPDIDMGSACMTDSPRIVARARTASIRPRSRGRRPAAVGVMGQDIRTPVRTCNCSDRCAHRYDDAAAPPAGLVDSVCAMTVDPATALSAEDDGRTYSFCGEGCRSAVVADPAAHPATDLGARR